MWCFFVNLINFTGMAALAHCKSLPRPVRPSCKEMWILDVEGREQSLGKKSLETGDGEAQQPLFPFLGWSTTGMCLLVSWMPSRNNRCYEVLPTRSLECFIVLGFFTQNLESYLKKKTNLFLYTSCSFWRKAYCMLLACSWGKSSSNGLCWYLGKSKNQGSLWCLPRMLSQYLLFLVHGGISYPEPDVVFSNPQWASFTNLLNM